MTQPYFNDGSVVKYTFQNHDLQVTWDLATSTAQFVASVPVDNYFSIGFGSNMYNTDMILWQNSASSAKTTDLWSTSHARPVSDTR